MRVLHLIMFSIMFSSCSQLDTTISALCEHDHKGGYVIKWEIFPEKDEDIVEVYASDNDSIFPSAPIRQVKTNKYITAIENADSLGFSFFKLKVGNAFSDVITNRIFDLEHVHNLRDLGGYQAVEGKRVRWRKIFRSGEFYKATKSDTSVINSLGIKTIIDFRSKRSQTERKDNINVQNRYSLYVSKVANDSVSNEVMWNRFLRGDAVLYMQDLYEDILVKRSEEYKRFFDLLIDENNYPVLFHCSLGKDQSGVAAFLLLKALGVSTGQAEEDYMLSNQGVDKSKIVAKASELSESQQEAFTMLTKTDIAYLRYGLACVKKEDGSLENYMINKLGLTKEKRQKLRDILLY